MTAASTYRYFAYCIRYSPPAEAESVFLIVGLCVGVGGSVLLLFAIVLSIAIHRKQTKKRQRRPPTDSTEQYSNNISRREEHQCTIEFNNYNDQINQEAFGDPGDGVDYDRRLYSDDHLGPRSGFQDSCQFHETAANISNPSLAFHGEGSKRFSWTRGAKHEDYEDQITENVDLKPYYAVSFPKLRPARPSKGTENRYKQNFHDYARNIDSIDENSVR